MESTINFSYEKPSLVKMGSHLESYIRYDVRVQSYHEMLQLKIMLHMS